MTTVHDFDPEAICRKVEADLKEKAVQEKARELAGMIWQDCELDRVLEAARRLRSKRVVTIYGVSLRVRSKLPSQNLDELTADEAARTYLFEGEVTIERVHRSSSQCLRIMAGSKILVITHDRKGWKPTLEFGFRRSNLPVLELHGTKFFAAHRLC